MQELDENTGAERNEYLPVDFDVGIDTSKRLDDTVIVEELQPLGSSAQRDVLERDAPDRTLEHATQMAECGRRENRPHRPTSGAEMQHCAAIVAAPTRAELVGEQGIAPTEMSRRSERRHLPGDSGPSRGRRASLHSLNDGPFEIGPFTDVADPLILIATDSARHVRNQQHLPGVGTIKRAHEESQWYDMLVDVWC